MPMVGVVTGVLQLSNEVDVFAAGLAAPSFSRSFTRVTSFSWPYCFYLGIVSLAV